MPIHRLLARAPIREAVVEIRVPALDGAPALATLREMASELEDYPTVHEGFEFHGKFRFGPQGRLDEDENMARPLGFRVISEDESQVVQLKLNGITIIRLEPYVSWEALQEEAKRIWDLYRERFVPTSVLRFGLRYVNHLRLPYPVSDLSDYLVGLPDHPDAWPQSMSSFLYRQTLHDSATDCAATIMHALADDVDESKIGVIFDIDAYTEGSFGVEDETVWGTFRELRDLKNRIFFSGITEQALALFG